MKVVVLHTEHIDEALAFFTGLGLAFVEEKHEKGPVHYACERNELVLEIYPATEKHPESLRIIS
jgi:lactoylglutathione lyase